MNVISVLGDGKRKTQRVTFEVDKNHFIVVKLFAEDSVWTVKVWQGSYNKTASYWNTKTAILGDERELAIKLAIGRIELARAMFGQLK
jgi:hypothetical protein